MLDQKEVQVKRIKNCTGSTMKNALLNALIHVSLNEVDTLLNKVTDKYVSENTTKCQ